MIQTCISIRLSEHVSSILMHIANIGGSGGTWGLAVRICDIWTSNVLDQKILTLTAVLFETSAMCGRRNSSFCRIHLSLSENSCVPDPDGIFFSLPKRVRKLLYHTFSSLTSLSIFPACSIHKAHILDSFLFIWTPFCFLLVFESTAYLKFAKLQYVFSGFRCRVIAGSLMRLY